MSASSKIEWTDTTWNPVVGCSLVSPGCDHCYAMNHAARLARMQPNGPYPGLTRKVDPAVGARGPSTWTGTVRCLPERLSDPLGWKRPRKVFVNSMSDLFHPDVPDQFIADVFDVMACHGQIAQHTFQVLTKRPQRMAALLNRWAYEDGYVGSPNVWLGVSVENQRYADLRIPHLLATPAAVRFLSIEPMLGPVSLKQWLGYNSPPDGEYCPRHSSDQELGWVIVGGESGPGARPMHPDWAREVRDDCTDAGVPFFFKQWGEWEPIETVYADDRPESAIDDRDEHLVALGNNGSIELDMPRGDGAFGAQPRPELDPWWLARVGKKHAGRELDGRTWDEYPESTPGIVRARVYSRMNNEISARDE